MNLKDLKKLYETALKDAELASTEMERLDYLKEANEYKKLMDSERRMSSDIENDESSRSEDRTWSFKSLVETICPTVATLGAAVLAFAGIKVQVNAQREMQAEMLASRERQLNRITKFQETDIPNASAIKLLNDVNK